MKILVTGANGFLGSHIIKYLVGLGYDVIGLKRSFSDTSRLMKVIGQFQIYDIDKISLKQIFQDNPINVVIHAATNYGKANTNLSHIIAANVMLPLQTLETLGESGLPATFINTDTFFNNPKFRDYNYLSTYSLSKKYFVELAEKYVIGTKATQFINVKIEHLYGPFDDSSKFVMNIMDKLINKESEIKLTPGNQQRDFIYIDDAVKAYACLIENRNKLGQISSFELGTGEAVSIRQFVNLAKEITESNSNLNFGALDYRDNEILYSAADSAALHRLGWKNSVSLKEGIANLFNSIRGGEV